MGIAGAGYGDGESPPDLRRANDTMRELSIKAHRTLSKSREPCMYPGGCAKKSSRAHAVQRNGPLSLLVENKHVIELRQEVGKSREAGPKMVAKSVGWKNAATFRGLCDEHDGELFRPIDGPLDFSDDGHAFLLAYRACLKTLYEHRLGVRLQEIGAENADKLRILPPGPNPLQVQAAHFEAAAQKVERFKKTLDAAYRASGYQMLDHEVLEVPGPGASVAASGMFSDRDDGSGAPAFMMVNLVPETNRHVLVLSYPRAQLAAHKPYVDLFRTRFQRGLRELTSRLIVLRTRSLALRPSLWASFPSSQQEAVQAALMKAEFLGDLVQDADRKINLFEAIA